jgi:uncharacterized protein Yka (UPF0111/DUF47 family)
MMGLLAHAVHGDVLDLLRRDVATCQSGVAALAAFLRDVHECKARSAAIHTIEHQGDGITAAIFACLRRGETRPFERGDLIALAGGIDDVLDGIDEVATLLVLYRVTQPLVYLREAVRLLGDAMGALALALDAIAVPEGIAAHVAAVHRLEAEADGLYHNAIAALFLPNTYPAIEVIKWHAILDVMERTIDRCEDLSNVLEAVWLGGRQAR